MQFLFLQFNNNLLDILNHHHSINILIFFLLQISNQVHFHKYLRMNRQISFLDYIFYLLVNPIYQILAYKFNQKYKNMMEFFYK